MVLGIDLYLVESFIPVKMKNDSLKTILLFLSLVFLVACGGDDNDEPPIPTGRTAEDVIADFKALEIKPGINDLSLESVQSGYYWNFRIILPEGADEGNKVPLVMNLHGGARSGNTEAHKSTACLVEPAFEGKEVIIVSPNSKGLLWYEEANIVQVLALMDLITSNLPVDLNRTVVTGYSDGGNGSWFFAQYYDQLFTAAIPLATSYNSKNSLGEISKIEVPMYVIHGDEDELFPVEITQGFVEESIEAGSDIVFQVAEGLGHYEPCDYTDYFKQAVVWLEQEVW